MSKSHVIALIVCVVAALAASTTATDTVEEELFERLVDNQDERHTPSSSSPLPDQLNDKYTWLLSEAFSAYTDCLVASGCHASTQQAILNFIEAKLSNYKLASVLRQLHREDEQLRQEEQRKAKRNAVVKKESNERTPGGKKKTIKDFLTIRF
jgi:hypothetical protein